MRALARRSDRLPLLVVLSVMILETVTNQDLPVIKCVLIIHKNNGSAAGKSSSHVMVPESPEDLRCAPKHRSEGVVYEAVTVEVAQSASFTLQVQLTTPGDVSCLWVFKHSSLGCQPHFDLQNRRIVSMTILNVTETQAGEYLLHIQSEATNHTVLFTVNVREKGFINATSSQEEYEIDPYEKFCFSVRFKAYPQIRCKWTFSQTSFPCEQSGLEDGYSISKFCDHKNNPGEYIFHGENDDAQFTKMFILNIRRKPQVLANASASQASCFSDGYPLPNWTWKKCSDKSPK